ncbi:MAG: 5'-nucleotidase C-terminal domain-containing protein, partial [Opitutales bacterium]
MKKTSLTLAGLALAATASQAQVDFTLQVLHASDLEGGIEAISRAPNFAAIASELDTNLPTGVDGSLIVSAGDNYIPGPFFNAAGDSAIRGDLQAFYQDLFGEPGLTNIREGGGRLDIAIMNAIGFDASAIGNHEFDLGSDTFESIIEEDVRGSTLGDIRHLGAQFPYLSANLDFSGDGDLSNLFTSAILPSTDFALSPADAISGGNPPKIAEATVVEVAPGEFVGVVGATTQRLQIISSPSGTIVEGSPGGNDIPLLATQLQPVINDVIDGADNMLGNSDDVNKIVLVTHLQQLSRERQLAQLLEGVDIIVAGGSDSVLANADDVTSDTPTEQYPVIETGVDGNPVAIVSTNGEYSYLGQLVVPFDASGVLADTDADLDFDLDDLNLMINGPIESTDANVIALYGSLTTAFAPGTTGAQVEALVNSVTDVVNALDGLIAGYTALFIEGRREFVRSEETNMGNLTADANLWAAQQIDPSVQISFKNGGGIRAPIGAIDGVTGELLPTQPNPAASKPLGAVSQLDISNTLRFNNDLVTIELTGAGLLRILEHGFGASFLDATTDTFPATEGRYPQIGGLQVAYQPPVDTDGDGTIDLAVEILSIALTNLEGEITQVLRQDGAWVGTAETDSYTLVGLDFSIENNGDGYPFTDDDNDTPGDTSDDTDGVAVGNTVNPLLDNTGDNPELEEQEALFSFLQTFFGTPELAYSARETSPMADARIQNLEMRRNTVGVDFPVIPGGAIRLEPIASFDAQSFDESAAEIGAYDAVTQRVFVTSADGQLVRVLDASDVADGNFPQVDTIPAPFMDFEPNSVATFRGPLGAAVAVAWSDETGTAGRGHVTLHNPDTLANIGTPIEVGFLPDMLT